MTRARSDGPAQLARGLSALETPENPGQEPVLEVPGVPDRRLERPAAVEHEDRGEQRAQRGAPRETPGEKIRAGEPDESLTEHLEPDRRPHVREKVERQIRGNEVRRVLRRNPTPARRRTCTAATTGSSPCSRG